MEKFDKESRHSGSPSLLHIMYIIVRVRFVRPYVCAGRCAPMAQGVWEYREIGPTLTQRRAQCCMECNPTDLKFMRIFRRVSETEIDNNSHCGRGDSSLLSLSLSWCKHAALAQRGEMEVFNPKQSSPAATGSVWPRRQIELTLDSSHSWDLSMCNWPRPYAITKFFHLIILGCKIHAHCKGAKYMLYNNVADTQIFENIINLFLYYKLYNRNKVKICFYLFIAICFSYILNYPYINSCK